ncbi:MAG: amino acid ABC transporter permease [Chloroflexi bacterium]|nr:amino acid ABC transporter permease [Chloroflexota bacterium]
MLQGLIDVIPYLLQGTSVTLSVTLVALSLGFTGGMFLAVMRVYGPPIIRRLAAGYSLVMRAVPVLLVILIMSFVISAIINLPPFWAGSLSLALASSAYQSEIFRGAIIAIPKGQMVAARALGMGQPKAILNVIMPQAIRNAIAPWSNEAAIILKDSSLVYVLGVPEILRRAQYYSARSYEPFLAFGAAALVYFTLTFLTNRGLDALENRIRIPYS